VFFTNVATTFHFSYQRFLINQLRDKFGFIGSPIRVQVRRRKKGGRETEKRRPERAPQGSKRTKQRAERTKRRSDRTRRRSEKRGRK
jgi:hypothetical protein